MKSGRSDSLYALAIELTETLPLGVEIESKSERGYRLQVGDALRPVRTPALAFGPETSVEEAMREILDAGVWHMVRNAKVFQSGRQPESVHQMRVAIRRLRAAFAAFNDQVKAPESAALRDNLRSLAGMLGAARDLDVFAAEALEPLVRTAGPDPRFDRLEQSVKAAREKAYEAAYQRVSSPAYTRLVLDLRRYIDGRLWRRNDATALGGLEKPILGFASAILERRYKKVLKAGRRLESLHGEERHEMRIQMKKLRYAGDFFASLYPRKSVKTYLGKIADFQDRLGLLNDVETADRLIQGLVGTAASRARSDLAFAGGLVVGWKTQRAQREWKKVVKLWPDFVETRPFWKQD